MSKIIRHHAIDDMVLAECELGGQHWVSPEDVMYDGRGEVAGRAPKVKLVTREEAIEWLDTSAKWERLSLSEDLMRGAMRTILALYADNARLVEALEAIEDADTGTQIGQIVRTALRQHKEAFGE